MRSKFFYEEVISNLRKWVMKRWTNHLRPWKWIPRPLKKMGKPLPRWWTYLELNWFSYVVNWAMVKAPNTINIVRNIFIDLLWRRLRSDKGQAHTLDLSQRGRRAWAALALCLCFFDGGGFKATIRWAVEKLSGADCPQAPEIKLIGSTLLKTF